MFNRLSLVMCHAKTYLQGGPVVDQLIIFFNLIKLKKLELTTKRQFNFTLVLF